jgi:hypothetical protein
MAVSRRPERRRRIQLQAREQGLLRLYPRVKRGELRRLETLIRVAIPVVWIVIATRY